MTRVSTIAEIETYVRDASAPFEIVAGGTRRQLGKPTGDIPVLDVCGLAGIIKYEPEELIITAAPSTPLTEIKAVLAQRGQCLGFDPMDWSGLWNSSGTAAPATLGGAVSSDASGPGRLRHGPARDSLLGFSAVNGLGESFRAGGKVVKNVTGFDIPKLVCGAFGTLCVLTELTFRVYPRAPRAVTLALGDADPITGFAALRKVQHSALEATGLAYLPGSAAAALGLGDVGKGAALIRLEGADAPLDEKISALKGLLSHAPMTAIASGTDAFHKIGSGALFHNSDADLWRLTVTPTEAPRVAAALTGPWVGDWAGGLIWATGGSEVRALAAQAGGHAMLVRAPAATRTALGLYAPQPKALADVAARVKAAFDPKALFNPGRL